MVALGIGASVASLLRRRRAHQTLPYRTLFRGLLFVTETTLRYSGARFISRLFTGEAQQSF